MRVIIQEGFDKIKESIEAVLLSVPRDLFIGLIVLLVGTASFGLGRLSGQEIAKSPVRILYPEGEGSGAPREGSRQVAAAASALERSGEVIASSKGTKYHFPWCPGAKSISEKNRITYASPAAAESAGYSLAANCK